MVTTGRLILLKILRKIGKIKKKISNHNLLLNICFDPYFKREISLSVFNVACSYIS